jgi:hypothetical protein
MPAEDLGFEDADELRPAQARIFEGRRARSSRQNSGPHALEKVVVDDFSPVLHVSTPRPAFSYSKIT